MVYVSRTDPSRSKWPVVFFSGTESTFNLPLSPSVVVKTQDGLGAKIPDWKELVQSCAAPRTAELEQGLLDHQQSMHLPGTIMSERTPLMSSSQTRGFRGGIDGIDPSMPTLLLELELEDVDTTAVDGQYNHN